jgi:hypothetical protein
MHLSGDSAPTLLRAEAQASARPRRPNPAIIRKAVALSKRSLTYPARAVLIGHSSTATSGADNPRNELTKRREALTMAT